MGGIEGVLTVACGCFGPKADLALDRKQLRVANFMEAAHYPSSHLPDAQLDDFRRFLSLAEDHNGL
jgi:hypothetical protein